MLLAESTRLLSLGYSSFHPKPQSLGLKKNSEIAFQLPPTTLSILNALKREEKELGSYFLSEKHKPELIALGV